MDTGQARTRNVTSYGNASGVVAGHVRENRSNTSDRAMYAPVWEERRRGTNTKVDAGPVRTRKIPSDVNLSQNVVQESQVDDVMRYGEGCDMEGGGDGNLMVAGVDDGTDVRSGEAK